MATIMPTKRLPKKQLNLHVYLHAADRADPNKPVLVLLAGLGCDGKFWAPLLPDLEQNYNCIIVDNPGTGQTPYTAFFTAEDMAKAVLEKLGQMGIEYFLLLGHSLGGFIAQAIAAKAQSRVRAMVLLNTSLAGPHMQGSIRRFEKLFLRYWPATLKAWHGGSDQIIKLFFADDVYRQQPALFFSLVSYLTPRRRLKTHLSHLFCALQFSGHQYVTKIDVPTLVVHGAQDIIISPEDGLALCRSLKHSHFVQVTAGHYLPYEIPELGELINGYLHTRDVPPAALLTGLDAPMSDAISEEEEQTWLKWRKTKLCLFGLKTLLKGAFYGLLPSTWRKSRSLNGSITYERETQT